MKRIIDKELLDLSQWPAISTDGLSQLDTTVATARMSAIKAYVNGATMKEIKGRFGFRKNKILRLFQRCISLHADGRIWGFRACLKYIHVKPYEVGSKSSSKISFNGNGNAGKMKAVFSRFPHILEELLERALQNRNKEFSESSIRMDRLHARFIMLCKLAGIKGDEYPFTVESLGERSFRTYIKREIFKRNFRAAVSAKFGDEAAHKLGSDFASPRIGRKGLCYERVELDEHRIDIHSTQVLSDPKGGEPLIVPLERIWILAIIETCSRVILGCSISLNRHYTSEDVLICLENAIRPWTPKKLTIPGLMYADGAGMPSGVIPGLAYAKFGELAFDNDKSHLSNWVIERVQKEIGCSINPGPIKTPESRQFIERFFRSFEEAGFQRLPSTTGCNPADPRRRDPEFKAMKHGIRLDEIVEMIDVLIANYNATPTSALHGRSPLEYLKFALDRKSFFAKTIPVEDRATFSLTLKTKSVKVRGYLAQGIRPFVEIAGVRYYGERLNSSAHLVGKRLNVVIQTQDMRTVRAFLPNGEEFEILTVARAWAGSVHDLQTRKIIQRENRIKRLDGKQMPDPVEAYIEFKKNEKKRSKKTNNQITRMIRLQESALPEPEKVVLDKPIKKARRVLRYKLNNINLAGVNY